MPSTPSDITLAVGDGARRMTYAELAAVRGISALSAERLVRRHKWPRQIGNDGVVRVLVPLTEARKDGVRFGCALCIEVCFPELFAEYERLHVDSCCSPLTPETPLTA